MLLSTLHSVLELLNIHLQDNSQMYEQWLAIKCEEDRKIQSSLTHKLGTVPLLHVVFYLFMLLVLSLGILPHIQVGPHVIILFPKVELIFVS